MHERTPGTSSTVTRQFGQSPVPQNRPRRRWYFKDRENVRIPARYSADAIVSPSSTGIRFRPSRSLPPTYRTSFVVVSRVTVIHRRQPRRWNHRSSCEPALFSGRNTRAKSASTSGASTGRSSPPQANSVDGRQPQFGHGTFSATDPAVPARDPATRRARLRIRERRSRLRRGALPPRTGRDPRPAFGTETMPASAASRTAVRC